MTVYILVGVRFELYVFPVLIIMAILICISHSRPLLYWLTYFIVITIRIVVTLS